MQIGAVVPGSVVYLDGHELRAWPGGVIVEAPPATACAVQLGATVQLEEEDRQLVILALAKLAIARPGFEDALHRIALRIDNRTGEGRAQMFDELRALGGRS